MRLWRIAAETREYTATDLSGAGAAKNPGRWNAEKEPVVYCASSMALCVLETAAHVDTAGLPLNRFLVEIDVPDAVWSRRTDSSDASKLPAGWDAVPAGRASVEFGSRWLASRSSAAMTVPSVIVPEEAVVLLNPAHPDHAGVTARAVRRFEYDLLWRSRS